MVEFARTLGLYRTAQVAANLEGGLSISRFTGNSGQSANLARIGYQVTNPPDVFFFRDSQWLAPPTLIETVNAHFEIISGDTTAQQRISWTPTEFLPQGDLYAREVADSDYIPSK
jgi:hypothetical protein